MLWWFVNFVNSLSIILYIQHAIELLFDELCVLRIKGSGVIKVLGVGFLVATQFA